MTKNLDIYHMKGKVTVLTNYYRSLLGEADNTAWNFDVASLYSDLPVAQPEPLIQPFSEQEAIAAVKSMNADSAPGPDGIGPAFYDAAWAMIRPDLMCFLDHLRSGHVDLERINRAHIVCCPSTPELLPPTHSDRCPCRTTR